MSDIETADFWDRYDPNWKAKWQEHFDAFNHYARSEKNHDDLSDQARLDRQAKIDFHLEGQKSAWVSQFKNARGYATFLVDQQKSNAKMHGYIWAEPDLSHVQTFDDANDIYKDVCDFIKKQENVKRRSLPVTKNSPVFKPNATEHYDLHLAYFGNGQHVDTSCVVSIESMADKTRICLHENDTMDGTYKKKTVGVPSVLNAFCDIATLLYHDQLKTNYNTSQTKWFYHRPPGTETFRESFSAIDLHFKNDVFYQMHFFDDETALPYSLKNAPFETNGKEIYLSLDKLTHKDEHNPILKKIRDFTDSIKDYFGIRPPENKKNNLLGPPQK